MHIICPHCSTSYAVNLATLGEAGRTVRCSRCKEVWLARPEDATALAVPAMAEAAGHGATDGAAAWGSQDEQPARSDTPVVDSPSIAGDWPGPADPAGRAVAIESDWTFTAHRDDQEVAAAPRRDSWFRRLLKLKSSKSGPFTSKPAPRRGKSLISLPIACAAMGALVMALMFWRVEVVRLLPQTAAFYSMVGFDVNMRGLAFKDVKITTETVEGKPVLVIEGVIVGEASKPVELPRLRFSVRDARGAEIYAWNAVLDQPVLKPGERAWFKSRLASPPPEGRNIDVRFFSRRDIAGGSI